MPSERIPVGTRVVVSGTGFGAKSRKGVVRPPALDKGYWVQFDHAPALHRCPDKKVKRATPEKVKRTAAGRRSTKLTIPDDKPKPDRFLAHLIEEGAAFPAEESVKRLATKIAPPASPHCAWCGSDGCKEQCLPKTFGETFTALTKPAAPRRSPAYLAHIRRMDCCNCGAPAPSDPHHEGKRGVGQKCSDLLTAPLCRRCHRIYTDENQLPLCVDGKDRGRHSREGSLAILHGTQWMALSAVVEGLPLQKRAEVLAAAMALIDEETMKEILK